MRRALILGGSGNVGSKLVKALTSPQSPYTSITIISRRSLPQYQNSSTIRVKVIEDLSRLSQESYEQYDAGFMLLGVGKPSLVSKEELFHIDAEIPIEFGRVCREKCGIQHMAILSALGADISQNYHWLTKTNAAG